MSLIAFFLALYLIYRGHGQDIVRWLTNKRLGHNLGQERIKIPLTRLQTYPRTIKERVLGTCEASVSDRKIDKLRTDSIGILAANSKAMKALMEEEDRRALEEINKRQVREESLGESNPVGSVSQCVAHVDKKIKELDRVCSQDDASLDEKLEAKLQEWERQHLLQLSNDWTERWKRLNGKDTLGKRWEHWNGEDEGDGMARLESNRKNGR